MKPDSFYRCSLSLPYFACGAPARPPTTLKDVEPATTGTIADIALTGDSIGDVLGFEN
jgi:hypothetical protein